MGDKRPYKPRKPGAGRKPLKPSYDAAAILQEQMEAAVALYTNNSLQTIADTLSLNPIKVRKLLITAGVYESEIADAVNSAFEEKQGMPYKEALEAVAAELNLSKACISEKTARGSRSALRQRGFDECDRGRKQLKRCRAVMMNSISGSASLFFKDTGSRRYLDCRFPIRSRPGGMGN